MPAPGKYAPPPTEPFPPGVPALPPKFPLAPPPPAATASTTPVDVATPVAAPPPQPGTAAAAVVTVNDEPPAAQKDAAKSAPAPAASPKEFVWPVEPEPPRSSAVTKQPPEGATYAMPDELPIAELVSPSEILLTAKGLGDTVLEATGVVLAEGERDRLAAADGDTEIVERGDSDGDTPTAELLTVEVTVAIADNDAIALEPCVGDAVTDT